MSSALNTKLYVLEFKVIMSSYGTLYSVVDLLYSVAAVMQNQIDTKQKNTGVGWLFSNCGLHT